MDKSSTEGKWTKGYVVRVGVILNALISVHLLHTSRTPESFLIDPIGVIPPRVLLELQLKPSNLSLL